MTKKIIALLVIASFFQFSLPQATIAKDSELKALPVEKTKVKKNDFVEGEVIVKYKSEKKQKAAVEKFQTLGSEKTADTLEVKDDFADLRMATLKSDKKSTSEMLDELKKDVTVEFAEPNYKKELSFLPNDTRFSLQWAANNTGQTVNGDSGTFDADIDAAEMWDIESAGAGSIIIAVLDDGVEYDNADLVANMWDGSAGCKSDTNVTIPGGCPHHGWDFENNDSSPEAQYDYILSLLTNFSHGSFVSSVIGSQTNNTRGIAGTSRYGHNKVMAVRFGLDVASEIRAINFAKNNGVKVINASFVGSDFSQSEKNAIDAFPGIFITAAGNAGDDVGAYPQYPCTYSSANVICVGASDQNDNLSSFSNYGATSVDIAAPGENIAGLATDNTYVAAYGTSFSTPLVAGIVGVLWSQTPGASIATIRNTLLQSSDHKSQLSGKTVCGRRLNANTALANMRDGIVPSETCTPIVYRFWSDTKQGHFYTASENEKNDVIRTYDDATWKFEGVAFRAYLTQLPNTTPIHRFWSDTKQHHFYTASAAEKDSVIATYPTNVWKYEGIAYYAYAGQQANTNAIYRFWSDTKQGHFYTSSAAEKDSVIATYPTDVWKYEGVAWYVPTN